MTTKSKLHYLVIPAILLLTACSSTTDNKNKYSHSIDSIITSASVPMIQWSYYSQGTFINSENTSPNYNTPAPEGETVFQAASLSKPVFAWIVLKMALQDEIDLDAPIDADVWDKRIPTEFHKWASMLTPRIILSHKSGLPNWASSPSSQEWPESKLLFRYRPDSIFHYSGEAYVLLQKQIEKIKGKTLEEIAVQEIFKPLGMYSTSYVWERDIMPLPDYHTYAAEGFDKEGNSKGQGRHPRASSAYTLRTTAKDYSLFLKELTAESVISLQIRKLMFKTHVNATRYPERPRECDKKIFWGLGAGIERNPELGDIFFHWGDNGSFKALFVIVPSRKSHLVYFTNSEHGHSIINEITELFFHNERPLALNNWINE